MVCGAAPRRYRARSRDRARLQLVNARYQMAVGGPRWTREHQYGGGRRRSTRMASKSRPCRSLCPTDDTSVSDRDHAAAWRSQTASSSPIGAMLGYASSVKLAVRVDAPVCPMWRLNPQRPHTRHPAPGGGVFRLGGLVDIALTAQY